MKILKAMRRYINQHLPYLLAFIPCVIFLILAITERIHHVYLEDDMIWFLPFIEQLMQKMSMLEFLKTLHVGELTFADGGYFSLLLSLFGLQLRKFLLISVILHLANSTLLYHMLFKRIKLKQKTSIVASLIYMTFYGHFHAYTWLMAAHHLWVTFFLLILVSLYLKIDSLIEKNENFKVYYLSALCVSIIASVQRLSVLIIPLIIFTHILFSNNDNKKIYSKYRLWSPLFIIFAAYQLLVFLLEGHGDILSGFLEPLYAAVKLSKDIFSIFWAITLCALAFVIFGLLLQQFLRYKKTNIFIPIIKKLSFLIIIIPQAMSWCLAFFFWPIKSSLSDEASLRFQQLVLPSGLTSIIFIVFAITLSVFFLRYMVKRNRHLIVFIVWYIVGALYLRQYTDHVSSRYLMYISPMFSVALSLFFVEIIPSFISKKLLKKYMPAAAFALALILCANIFSIKIRSIRTLLVDYRWSYDYIKIANIIKKHIEKTNKKPPSICISGITNTPYASSWKDGFLKKFDFSDYTPFRQTISSLFPQTPDIVVNAQCPESNDQYTLSGTTVILNRNPVDPFCLSFKNAKEALQSNNLDDAMDFLKEAIEIKPFALRTTTSSVLFKSITKYSLTKKLSDTIHSVYAHQYDGDKKINFIDTMIRAELNDYATALALLAYLQHDWQDISNESVLLKDSALFLRKEDIIKYASTQSFLSNYRDSFLVFINKNNRIFERNKRKNPWVHMETYRGFDIIQHGDFYFCISKLEDPFSLADFKSSACSYCSAAKTKHELRTFIDSALIDKPEMQKKLFFANREKTSKYKGFTIKKIGDIYSCVFTERDVSAQNNAPAFKARSLHEAKLIIDTFSQI